jgi:hypothetical protein
MSQFFLILALSSAPAPTCPPGEPRLVRDNVIESAQDPAVRIRVDPALRYIGPLRFVLKGVACVERHVFAETADRRVRRLFIAQFESFLEGSDEVYRWTVRNPVRLGDTDYQHNVFFYDETQAIWEEPEAEAAKTRAFLESKGLKLDSELAMSRYARVVGEEKRKELILFYFEPLAGAGFRVADFDDGAARTDSQRELARRLEDRAAQAFTVLPKPGRDYCAGSAWGIELKYS